MLIKESIQQFTVDAQKYTLPYDKESANFVKNFLHCQKGYENIQDEAAVMNVPGEFSVKTPYKKIPFNDYRFKIFSKYYKFIEGKIFDMERDLSQKLDSSEESKGKIESAIRNIKTHSFHLRGHLIELFTKLHYYYNLPEDEENQSFRKSVILDSIQRISKRIVKGHFKDDGTKNWSTEHYPNKLPTEVLIHLIFLTFKFAKDGNFKGKDFAKAEDIGGKYFTFFVSDTHSNPSFSDKEKKNYDILMENFLKNLNISNYKIKPVRFLLGTLLSHVNTKSVSQMEDSSFKLSKDALKIFYENSDKITSEEKLPNEVEEILNGDTFGKEFRESVANLAKYSEKKNHGVFIKIVRNLIKKYKKFAFFFTQSELEKSVKYAKVNYLEKKEVLERIKSHVIKTIFAYDTGNFFDKYIEELIDSSNYDMEANGVEYDDPEVNEYKLDILKELTDDIVSVTPTLFNGIPLSDFSDSFKENFKKLVVKKTGQFDQNGQEISKPIEGLPDDILSALNREWKDEADPERDIESSVRLADSDNSIPPIKRKYEQIDFFEKLEKVSQYIQEITGSEDYPPTVEFYNDVLFQIEAMGSGDSDIEKSFVDGAYKAVFESDSGPKNVQQLESSLELAKENLSNKDLKYLSSLLPSDDEEEIARDELVEPVKDNVDPPEENDKDDDIVDIDDIYDGEVVSDDEIANLGIDEQPDSGDLPPKAFALNDPKNVQSSQAVQQDAQSEQSVQRNPIDSQVQKPEQIVPKELPPPATLINDPVLQKKLPPAVKTEPQNKGEQIQLQQPSPKEDDEIYVIDDDEEPEKILELLEKNKIEYEEIPNKKLRLYVLKLKFLKDIKKSESLVTDKQNRVLENCSIIFDHYLTMDRNEIDKSLFNNEKIIKDELSKDIPFNNGENIKKLLEDAISSLNIDNKKIFEVFGGEDKDNNKIEDISPKFLYSIFIDGQKIPNRTSSYLANKDKILGDEKEKFEKEQKDRRKKFEQELKKWKEDLERLRLGEDIKVGPRPEPVSIKKYEPNKKQININIDDLHQDIVDEFIYRFKIIFFVSLYENIILNLKDLPKNILIEKLQKIHNDSLLKGQIQSLFKQVVFQERYSQLTDDDEENKTTMWKKIEKEFLEFINYVSKILPKEFIDPILSNIRETFYTRKFVQNVEFLSTEELLQFLDEYRKTNELRKSDYDDIKLKIEKGKIPHLEALKNEINSAEENDEFLTFSWNRMKAEDSIKKEPSSTALIRAYTSRMFDTIKKYKDKNERKEKLEKLKQEYDERIRLAKEREKVLELSDDESEKIEEDEIEEEKAEREIYNLSDDDMLILDKMSEIGGLRTFEILYKSGVIPKWAKDIENSREKKKKKADRKYNKKSKEQIRDTIKIILDDEELLSYVQSALLNSSSMFDAFDILKFNSAIEMKNDIERKDQEKLDRFEKSKKSVEELEAEANLESDLEKVDRSLDRRRAIKPKRDREKAISGELNPLGTAVEFDDFSGATYDPSSFERRRTPTIATGESDDDDTLNESKMKILFKVKNNTKDDTKSLESVLSEFLPYAQNYLGFTKPVTIILDHPKDSSNLFAPTGQYDPSSNSVTIFIKNRHPKDILRSLAHELVHHLQNCKGMFNSHLMGDGAVEGYAQKNGYLRSLEKEANATMMLRDFEDRNKKPLNENSNWALKWKEFILKERKKYVRR